MSLPLITPSDAKALVERGAILIDIREIDEFARERIPQSKNAPLSKLDGSTIGSEDQAIVFLCKSGARTVANAPRLKASASCEAFIIEGGIEAWKRAGFPVAVDKKQPIEMMRQVQIAAGSLVVLGAVLGYAVAPGFYALSGAVGAGLMFSGISGTCAMARILKLMPWNSTTA